MGEGGTGDLGDEHQGEHAEEDSLGAATGMIKDNRVKM